MAAQLDPERLQKVEMENRKPDGVKHRLITSSRLARAVAGVFAQLC